MPKSACSMPIQASRRCSPRSFSLFHTRDALCSAVSPGSPAAGRKKGADLDHLPPLFELAQSTRQIGRRCFSMERTRSISRTCASNSREAAKAVELEFSRNGDPGKTRTSDTQFRKLLLYPPELRGHVYYNKLPTSMRYSALPLTPCDIFTMFWHGPETIKGARVESQESTVSTG